MGNNYLVDYQKLEEFCRDIFMAKGLNAADARVVADSLVDADLRNVISHGVVRVGNYVDRLNHGGALAKPEIKVLKETPVSLLVDGGDGLGAVVSEYTVQKLREKAETSGMAFGVVIRSNHFGAAARWAIELAGDDMVAMAGSNVEPLICVTGGASKGIGNNPFTYAFPTGKYGTVCYDVACSVMAGGKMFEYRRENKTLPDGAFLDKDGKPTNNPHEASLMMPFGGHKGYGLAVVVEMFSSVLGGGCFGYEMGSQYGKLDSPNHIAHYFMVMRVDLFRKLDEYRASADGFVEYLHSLPRAEGVDHLYFPGEIEQSFKAKRMTEGLPLPGAVAEDLKRIATEAGLDASKADFLFAKQAK